jgi:hypothetical protein
LSKNLRILDRIQPLNGGLKVIICHSPEIDGSLAVNQRRSLNDCFLSKENSSWAQTTTSQRQESAKEIIKHGCTDQTN